MISHLILNEICIIVNRIFCEFSIISTKAKGTSSTRLHVVIVLLWGDPWRAWLQAWNTKLYLCRWRRGEVGQVWRKRRVGVALSIQWEWLSAENMLSGSTKNTPLSMNHLWKEMSKKYTMTSSLASLSALISLSPVSHSWVQPSQDWYTHTCIQTNTPPHCIAYKDGHFSQTVYTTAVGLHKEYWLLLQYPEADDPWLKIFQMYHSKYILHHSILLVIIIHWKQ